MKKKLGAVFSVAIGLLMATGSLWAHHSDALYDMSRLKVIKGTVTKHQLLNPHQVIRMKVKDADGKVTPWILIGAAVKGQREEGWTKDTLKPGDEVTVWGFAYRDGGPRMTWNRIDKADGTPPMYKARNEKVARWLRVYGKHQLSKEDYADWNESLNYIGNVDPKSITRPIPPEGTGAPAWARDRAR